VEEPKVVEIKEEKKDSKIPVFSKKSDDDSDDENNKKGGG
jgi:hypothetical protein